MDTCSVPDCDRTDRAAKGLCWLHYQRQRRTGTTERAAARRTVLASGYVRVGREYEHRVVLRQALGEGPLECADCSIKIEWDAGGGRAPKGKGRPWGNAVVVDHLNFDRSDNRVENLRAVCPRCSGRRKGGRRVS